MVDNYNSKLRGSENKLITWKIGPITKKNDFEILCINNIYKWNILGVNHIHQMSTQTSICYFEFHFEYSVF